VAHASPSQPTLQVWFEFASTYSHVAVQRIDAAIAGRGIRLEWRPFLLGPIFHQQGWDDSPFNIYPAKGAYMWRDLERLCEKHGIPFRKPSRFPRGGLLASRVAIAAEREPWLEDFIQRVYLASFAEDREISSPDVLMDLLQDVGCATASVWIERAEAPEIKLRLREQTEQAIALGIFGAPSFVARGELFWGQDRLEDAIEWSTSHE